MLSPRSFSKEATKGCAPPNQREGENKKIRSSRSRDASQERGEETWQDNSCTADPKRRNQMGKEDGRASRESLQEKKRANRSPDVSDHMENTILGIFQFCWRDWKKVVTVK